MSKTLATVKKQKQKNKTKKQNKTKKKTKKQQQKHICGLIDQKWKPYRLERLGRRLRGFIKQKQKKRKKKKKKEA